MRILVDADACPVTDIAIDIAVEYKKEIILFYDDSHQTYKEYAKIVMVPKGNDAVDYALLNECKKGDVVISQDYGVATIALSKGAYVINQNGMIYDENNIGYLLEIRASATKSRNSKRKTHFKGQHKRTSLDDVNFKNNMIKLVEKCIYD